MKSRIYNGNTDTAITITMRTTLLLFTMVTL